MRAEARGEGPPAGRSGAAGAGSGAAASGPPVGGPPCGRILRLAATGQGGYRDFYGTEKQGGDKKPYKVRVVRKSGTLRNRRLTDLMVGLVVRNRAEW